MGGIRRRFDIGDLILILFVPPPPLSAVYRLCIFVSVYLYLCIFVSLYLYLCIFVFVYLCVRRRFDIGDLILILFVPPPSTTVCWLLALLSDRPILSNNILRNLGHSFSPICIYFQQCLNVELTEILQKHSAHQYYLKYYV